MIAEQANKGRELRAVLNDWLASFQQSVQDQDDIELDELVMKRLEDLGYLTSDLHYDALTSLGKMI